MNALNAVLKPLSPGFLVPFNIPKNGLAVEPVITEVSSATSVALAKASALSAIYLESFAAILSISGSIPVIFLNSLAKEPNHIGLITILSGVDINPSANVATPL